MCTTRLSGAVQELPAWVTSHSVCLYRLKESTNYCHGCSVGTDFPGFPLKIHGLFAQNSSLWISTCSTTTLAFALAFRIFSLRVFDSTAASSGTSVLGSSSEF